MSNCLYCCSMFLLYTGWYFGLLPNEQCRTMTHVCTCVWCMSVQCSFVKSLLSPCRAGGRTPRTPRPGGGPRVCQGPHVTLHMKFFSSFLMFLKYLWRYSCKMKSTGSVLTYLIFEFLIPACYTYTLAPIRVHSAHTVYENALLFFLEYQTWGLTVLLGAPAKYQLWGPGGGWRGLSGATGRGLSEAPGGGPPTL